MDIWQFVKSRSRLFFISLAILSIISSLANLTILRIINTAFANTFSPAKLYMIFSVFFILLIFSFLTTIYFQKKMSVLTNEIVFHVEVSLIEKVRNASLQSFEKLGAEKIYIALADSWTLGRMPELSVNVLNSIVCIICSLGYLFWLSKLGCVLVFMLMCLLLLFYLIINNRNAKILNEIRSFRNEYYATLNELLYGFKQVKVSKKRNNTIFYEHVLRSRTLVKELGNKAATQYATTKVISIYSWYLIIGTIVFILPTLYNLKAYETASFIAAVLFMMGPISNLIEFMPFYTYVKISLSRIHEIDDLLTDGSCLCDSPVAFSEEFKSIQFEDVIYKYENSNNPGFSMKLGNFSIFEKEVIFITGKNGSGKTTFLNLLTGLYSPQSGRVFIDGNEVQWKQFSDFSSQMSIVFNDQYLFTRNFDDHDLSDNNRKVNYLKQLLNLDNVLVYNEKSRWFDKNLSKGQQKRIALLLALLEEKPIIVLDEWAAEQDPDNRKYFYNEWLPIIKNMGKTVIAITHDDEYFHLADRVIKFEYGKIMSEVHKTSVGSLMEKS